MGRERAVDVLILAMAWLGYVGSALWLGPAVGAGILAAAVVPVALTGHRFGVIAGAAAGAVALAVNALLLTALGRDGMSALMREGGGPGTLLIIAAGAALGYVHRLDERARRLARTLDEQQAELRDAHAALRGQLERQSEYVSAIAREITNPLIGIQVAANVLAGRQRGDLDPATTAARIADEAGLALELVRGMSAAASAETGRTKLRSDPVDVAALARDVVEGFDPRGHPVMLEAPPTLRTLADPDAVATILRHLLGNAAKYSPPAAPIRVRTVDAGEAIQLSVRDHGPGVPESERAQLFQRFARLSTAGGTSGAGLGLYICEVIARELGGSMRFHAPPGGGAEFTLLLPRA
ncbi:MAG TPA: HAMP domain-containing sensor histidine kinase [Candidatus Limnocylindria bacterium]|nr:HAMP domain-containing sensor histidine kinase [Candidatus Limnocylindria bacterium]